ncbi:MAG: sigma-70 family RNA polymerase sigma factor [Candidatus Tritonobacter lacicola]|nr:sigma-70 family RNA polymerase sigma factor [Candidatus Tritonobacter lacicola]
MREREFERIFEKYENLVWSIIRNYGPPDADAWDLFMVIWEAVLKALPSYGGRAKLSTWICGIAKNKCIDYVRRRCRNPLSGAEPIDSIGPLFEWYRQGRKCHSPSPAGGAMRREAREAIQWALGKLPPRQRKIMELRMAGNRYRTIAEILNAAGADPVDANYVGKQIYLTKARLAELLGERGIASLDDIWE